MGRPLSYEIGPVLARVRKREVHLVSGESEGTWTFGVWDRLDTCPVADFLKRSVQTVPVRLENSASHPYDSFLGDPCGCRYRRREHAALST